MKDQPPIFFNRYQHPFGHTSRTSEIILTDPIYRLVAGGETSPWVKPPPVISPPVVIFRRIGVRAEIRTQNPVLSNTRLSKIIPLSHLRQHIVVIGHPKDHNSTTKIAHHATKTKDGIKNINKIIVRKKVCVAKITIGKPVPTKIGKMLEIGHVVYCRL
jgi:hypothetical protein